MSNDKPKPCQRDPHCERKRERPPELYQVVIECRDEADQRELFERMRQEGRKVRLLVL